MQTCRPPQQQSRDDNAVGRIVKLIVCSVQSHCLPNHRLFAFGMSGGDGEWTYCIMQSVLPLVTDEDPGIRNASFTCSSVRLREMDHTRLRQLEAFHMKCQRQITKIRWQDHIRNSEVAACTGLGPVSDLITRRRNSVFGHIARLSEDMPAHQALRCHVDLTLGHLPDQR